MKTIKIFLASSEELKPERLELTEMVAHLNHTLKNREIVVELVKWEHLDSSMGRLHKQEEYSNELRDCDLCLVLYWTLLGQYTKFELDVAYHELCAGNNPKRIYVYFKDADGLTPEMMEFRDSFPTVYGHFFCNFSNVDTLKADFLLQFMEYMDKYVSIGGAIEIRNSQVIVGGKTYVDLNNVPFAGNNEKFNILKKSIEDKKKLLQFVPPDNPLYTQTVQELQELRKELATIEDCLWETALQITKLSTTQCSERLSRAMQLFIQGDNKGANAILDEQQIEQDVRHNLNLIELGKKGQKGLKTNIEEFELKAKTIKNEMSEGWGPKLCRLHERIIELTESLYGETSLEVASALTDAGSTYNLLRLDKQNLKVNQRALDIRRELLGEQHPDTAESYNNLGRAYGHLGILEKAKEYDQKALKINIIALGEVHLRTAESYNNVGCDFCQLGDYHKALEHQLKSIQIKVSTIGESHPSTAISYDNLSLTYCQLGEFEKALKYSLKALEILRSNYGDNHPDTSIAYDHVGNTYTHLEDYDKALEYQKKSIEIKVSLFGEKHVNTAIALNNAGKSFSNCGDFENALLYQMKGLEIKESVLGSSHVSTAHSYNDLGLAYGQLGEHKKAFEYLKRALEIYVSVFGENHPYTATSFNNVGYCYGELGDYDKALGYKLKALEIREEVLGKNNIDTTSSYYDLGNFYYELGNDYEQSIAFFNKALDSSCLKPTDKVLANKFISICCRELGDYEKALEYAQKALELGVQVFGEQHLEVAKCHNSVALACRKLNRLDEALPHFQAALEIRKPLLSPDDDGIKCSEKYIQDTQQLILDLEHNEA